jgi:hypothetical protein
VRQNSDMNPQAERSTQEVLAGLVERVTYHNAENGFCVLHAKARGHREMVTVVGHAATEKCRGQADSGFALRDGGILCCLGTRRSF